MNALAAHPLSSSGILLAALASAVDRNVVVLALVGRIPVRLCASAGELLRELDESRLEAGSIAAVVLDLDAPDARATLPAITSALRGSPVPLLLRLALTNRAIRTVLLHGIGLAGLRLSVQPYDSLESDISQLLSPPAALVAIPSARMVIISRSEPAVTRSVFPIVATAAVIGARAVSVDMLASACQLGVRTLQLRLAAAGLMAPKTLLQWMLALHAVWAISYERRRPADLAMAMGLRSADVLSDRVERITGLRLAEVCDSLGFEGLLGQFTHLLTTGSANDPDGPPLFTTHLR